MELRKITEEGKSLRMTVLSGLKVVAVDSEGRNTITFSTGSEHRPTEFNLTLSQKEIIELLKKLEVWL